MITKDEIQSLLHSTETYRIERTVSTVNMDKFCEAICAFANDLPDSRKKGYLLIGAYDDGRLSGLKVDDDLLKKIAAIRSDGNLDWLTKYPMPTGTEYGYKDLMDSIDTIIMGGKTYRAVLDMDFEWPYSDKACYIVSHRNTNLTPTKNVKFITENVVETVKALKQQDGKDIWLVGGGQVITLLLNHDLVDEMQICYIPVILGNGIPLFPNQPKESTWKFAGSEAYDSGIVKSLM